MSDSTQKKLGKVRPPRVQITYDVEVGDAVQQKVLPFVVGVVADLAPGGSQAAERLRDRQFIEIDADNFDKVMSSLNPTLKLSVDNRLSADGEKLGVTMSFPEMASFSPANVAKSVPQLARLLETRSRLNDLLAKLEGNDRLNDLLSEVVLNTEVQKLAHSEMSSLRDAGLSDGDVSNPTPQQPLV